MMTAGPPQATPGLWVVGQLMTRDRWLWTIEGVFSSERKAAAHCVTPRHFVGPLTIDSPLPHQLKAWPGAYFPRVARL